MIDANFYKKEDTDQSPTHKKIMDKRNLTSFEENLIESYKYTDRSAEKDVKVRRILLTGHKGFIGSHVYDFIMNKTVWRLQSGFELDCIDLKDGDDIADFKEGHPWWEKKYDVIIHLAAFAALRDSIENPNKFWKNNVQKAYHIFEYCKKVNKDGYQCKLIYASSAGAYEWWQNPYAITKIVNEVQAPPPPLAIGLRFFNVWAEEGSREDMLFRMLQDNTAKYITRHRRDYIHVSDVVSAIMTCIEHSLVSPRFIDVGTSKDIAVMEIAEAFGRDLPIKENEDIPGEPQCLRADPDWLIQMGWSSKIDIRDHLEILKKNNAI